MPLAVNTSLQKTMHAIRSNACQATRAVRFRHRQLCSFSKMVKAAATEPAVASPVVYEGVKVPEEVLPLVKPLNVGRYELKHRLVLAPLTRCRAIDTVPQSQAVLYYTQRTTPGGLLISEATCITPEAHGYPHTPGIYTPEQIEAWKPIVKAVHDKGGLFFLQLWHCGRASHSHFQPDGQPPKAPSAIGISEAWDVYTPQGGPFKYETPREMTKEDIQEAIQLYATAAKNAIEAGFDGVEVHGANGYLIDEFLKDGINKRTDEYGGPIENRARFLLEVVDAVIAAVGADRVGIRLSPFTTFLDAIDSHPYATHAYVLEELNSRNLAYAHLVESRAVIDGSNAQTLEAFRKVYNGVFFAAGGLVRDSALKTLREEHADAVVLGRWFLANPDLLKRWILDAPLNKYDRNTFYSHDQVIGYTDYPFLEEVEATPTSESA